MSARIPEHITLYLKSIQSEDRIFAYLGLDDHHKVVASGGALTLFGLDNIDESRSIVTQFNLFEGLLPGSNDPVVIPNTQTIKNLIFDLHLFSENDYQWILLIDNTADGKSLQEHQQVRLDNDILQEKRKRNIK